jgi:4-amino-4-deoxy-L-arabinose transferase-like glycosyltransferase
MPGPSGRHSGAKVFGNSTPPQGKKNKAVPAAETAEAGFAFVIGPGQQHHPAPARRFRALVLAVAVLMLIPKLWIAATTFGTNDVSHWETFAAAVRRVGPVGIYRLHFVPPYNHPPLVGWMLAAMNHLAGIGATIPFLIRAQSSIADVVTVLLVFEMLRAGRGLRAATAAALLVAVSPVLLIISGFHGNTDPVFVMFTLLSAYLLIHPRWPARAWVFPALAGIAFALAVSVKLVPVVVLPTLLLLAARLGRHVASFTAGSGVVFLPLWGPVILRQWRPFRLDVLSYVGSAGRPWGLPEFAQAAPHGASVVSFLAGPGRFLVLALSALLPALLLYWRRDAALPAIGLSLALFLLLSPAFGTQYLAWPLAAGYLIDFWAATAYNLVAGATLAAIYNRWSGGLPWNVAHATPLRPGEISLLAVIWTLLLLLVIDGLRRIGQSAGKTAVARAAGAAGFEPSAVREPTAPLIESGSASVDQWPDHSCAVGHAMAPGQPARSPAP